MDIKSLLFTHWGIAASQIVPLTEGLINQTWLVRGAQADYILQQINTAVFKKPLVLQAQLAALSTALQLPSLVPLQFISKRNGKLLLVTEEGTFRLLKAISPSTTLPRATVQNAQLAAEALLEFHQALSAIAPGPWKAPIADFLNVELRLNTFEKAKTAANPQRKMAAIKQIAAIEMQWNDLVAWQKLADQEQKVLIHADPKLGNFLFHPNGKQVRSIIDWDTIQLGTPYYDYGDMIRSFCSRGEDADEQAHLFQEEIFEVLVGVFAVDAAKLYTAAMGVILVQATRFLTDYLQDDIYYKVKDEEHNLRRAANQLRLASELKNYWLTTRRPTH